VGSTDARGAIAWAWVAGEVVMRDPAEREGERERQGADKWARVRFYI
jgi:hypothetical protein